MLEPSQSGETISAQRSFSSHYRKRGKVQSPKKLHSKNPSSGGNLGGDPRIQIQARPEGEKPYESKWPLPDPEMEQKLGRMQTEVIDLHRKGNYHKGLKSAQTLLEETKAHFGANHPSTAAAYNNTALFHKQLGNFVESRTDYNAALDIYQKILGEGHASYASALHNLGNLHRSQISFDGELKPTDRISLVEQALEYFQKAYTIRLAELGTEHPHTVSSKSSWGALLSSQVLYHQQMMRKIQETGDLAKKRFYESILPSTKKDMESLTAWEAAEEHLRKALATAMENPRGMRIQDKTDPTIVSKNTPFPRGGKKKSSVRKSNTSGSEGSTPTRTTPQTLSAANAAQNLAVFLKYRATMATPVEMEGLQEAHALYLQVLEVKTELLHEQHPDLFVTKYNLAECLTAMGDEEGANKIRTEILDVVDEVTQTTSATSVAEDTIDDNFDELGEKQRNREDMEVHDGDAPLDSTDPKADASHLKERGQDVGTLEIRNVVSEQSSVDVESELQATVVDARQEKGPEVIDEEERIKSCTSETKADP
jgi:tetratricopeptide (TPR) repeat protein